MKRARGIVFAAGVLFGLTGVAFLVWPVELAGEIGIRLESPLAAVDVRALYGGLDLGIGLFLGYAALHRSLLRAGALLQVAVFGGLVAGRTLGMAVEGAAGTVAWVLMAIEGAGFLGGWFALKRCGHSEETERILRDLPL
ncbi:MAG: DUF4345 domain-containing protein [bacterium]|nr:DUF4345 domain-containing protein [bacterium]